MSFVHSISFVNRSGLPVMVESWHSVTEGHNILSGQLVRDGEEVLLHSITGEWYLNCMFDDMSAVAEWRNRGFQHIELGKFSASGAFMDQDDFGVVLEMGMACFVWLRAQCLA